MLTQIFFNHYNTFTFISLLTSASDAKPAFALSFTAAFLRWYKKQFQSTYTSSSHFRHFMLTHNEHTQHHLCHWNRPMLAPTCAQTTDSSGQIHWPT